MYLYTDITQQALFVLYLTRVIKKTLFGLIQFNNRSCSMQSKQTLKID